VEATAASGRLVPAKTGVFVDTVSASIRRDGVAVSAAPTGNDTPKTKLREVWVLRPGWTADRLGADRILTVLVVLSWEHSAAADFYGVSSS
jgi:hypothetical protein